jgi:hypothetical protein
VAIQPRQRQRGGAGIKGNRPLGNNWDARWENLLDLCRSVYSLNNLWPVLVNQKGKLTLFGTINRKNLISGLLIAFITFFIALVVNLGSQVLVEVVNDLILSLLLLLLIIFLGIVFDIIGTAATAAEMPPFNARAAKKISGARQAVKIIKNAHLVANFCNDVVGDIAGTLSGALGAGIVLSLARQFTLLDLTLAGAVMTSLIAALTVGGKAFGKILALNHANQVIFRVALLISWWEGLTGIELFNDRR